MAGLVGEGRGSARQTATSRHDRSGSWAQARVEEGGCFRVAEFVTSVSPGREGSASGTRCLPPGAGRPDGRDPEVKGVEGRFEKIRTEHPEFKGKTGLMASPYEGYFIYGSQDPRSRLQTDLGFTLP